METSPTIVELAKALCKAQGEMEAVEKSESNDFFSSKYADLASVLAALKKPMTENGLSLIQAPETMSDGKIGLTTMLLHVSGEWARASLSMNPKDSSNPQVVVAIITYLRRCAASAFTGMAAKDEDDDGNTAAKVKEEPKKDAKKEEKKPEKTGKISTGQIKYVQTLFGKAGYKDDLDKHAYATGVANREIQSITDLTFKEASDTIEALLKLTNPS